MTKTTYPISWKSCDDSGNIRKGKFLVKDTDSYRILDGQVADYKMGLVGQKILLEHLVWECAVCREYNSYQNIICSKCKNVLERCNDEARKCKTKDCDRKVTPPTIYCSLECFAYDGNKLARNVYPYRFFENKECKYYPCHTGLREINCIFCFCPLFSFCQNALESNGKSCKECSIPHRAENYEDILNDLKRRYNLNED